MKHIVLFLSLFFAIQSSLSAQDVNYDILTKEVKAKLDQNKAKSLPWYTGLNRYVDLQMDRTRDASMANEIIRFASPGVIIERLEFVEPGRVRLVFDARYSMHDLKTALMKHEVKFYTVHNHTLILK